MSSYKIKDWRDLPKEIDLEDPHSGYEFAEAGAGGDGVLRQSEVYVKRTRTTEEAMSGADGAPRAMEEWVYRLPKHVRQIHEIGVKRGGLELRFKLRNLLGL